MAISVQGADKLRKALRKFAPDLAKETTKGMAQVMRPMTTKARGFLPADSLMLSGWTKAASSTETTNYRHFPKYEQTLAKRGVKSSVSPSRPNNKGFVSLARIVNTSAGGAIYETAGRKNPSGQPTFKRTKFTPASYHEEGHGFNKSLNPNAGKQFIDRANANGQLVNARATGMVGRATRKMTGRVIFRAFKEDQGKTTASIAKAIERSAELFNARTGV
jgi:hypothetical protein